jgi:hypothetical protein
VPIHASGADALAKPLAALRFGARERRPTRS